MPESISPELALQLIVTIAGVIGAYFTMREQLATTREGLKELKERVGAVEKEQDTARVTSAQLINIDKRLERIEYQLDRRFVEKV